MSGYYELIPRKKAGERCSTSAVSCPTWAHTAASSFLPFVHTAGAQLHLGGRTARGTIWLVSRMDGKKVAFPVASFTDVRNKHPHADIPPKAAAASSYSLASHPTHSGKDTSVPLPKIEGWGWGGLPALSTAPGQWASPHMNTSFTHVIQDTLSTGAEFCWYRPLLLWLFSGCGYFSFTIYTVLILCIFQHTHPAFSMAAALQNTLNRLNKITSFVRVEKVQLHLTLTCCSACARASSHAFTVPCQQARSAAAAVTLSCFPYHTPPP